MSKIFIRSCAFHDPRLVVLGREVRISASAVAWKLAFTWSQISDVEHPLMALDLVAVCIGREAGIVRNGLLRAGLASEHDTTTLDLTPLRSLFAESRDGDDDESEVGPCRG